MANSHDALDEIDEDFEEEEVPEDCKTSWGNKKNVPADALNFCQLKNTQVVSKTGFPPKKKTDYIKANNKLKCDCNVTRNAEIAGRKQIKVANNGRTEPKMTVRQSNAPCDIIDQSEICGVIKKSVFMGDEPVLESEPSGTTIQKSMMINGLFYTRHAAKKSSKNKMAGLLSLNTNPFDNPFCMRMSKDGCFQRACNSAHPFICGSCYSITAMSRQGASRWHFNNNLAILAKSIICDKQMPDFPDGDVVRFDAEGELVNNIQLINFINIAASNPQAICTLFTKRWDLLDDVINKCGYAPPTNMPIIYSNPYVDLPMTFDGLEYDFGHRMPMNNKYSLVPDAEFLDLGIVTGLFNVVYNMPRDDAIEYVKERISSHGETIVECALACFDCQRCYPKKGADARKMVIIEELKGLTKQKQGKS